MFRSMFRGWNLSSQSWACRAKRINRKEFSKAAPWSYRSDSYLRSKMFIDTLCFTFGLLIPCLSFEKGVEKGAKVKRTAHLNLHVQVCITVKFNSLYHIYWDLWTAERGLIHSDCRMFSDSPTKCDIAVNCPSSKNYLPLFFGFLTERRLQK